MTPSGTLYLIPAPLGDIPAEQYLPQHYHGIVSKLEVFIVENVRTARRLLRRLDPSMNIDTVRFHILDKQTQPAEIEEMLAPIKKGVDIGLMSEAGLPCIADPGAQAVSLAHLWNIRVIPIPGPSSIFLALEASGFDGQRFVFHGYLPRLEKDRKAKIRMLENAVAHDGSTQIFMETPYRNVALIDSLLQVCRPDTMLCIACDISLPSEFISTRPVSEWKKKKPDIHKRPSIFLLGKTAGGEIADHREAQRARH